jgi:hydroxymethylpyrimidine pyrophosphatase-like HAD family hydrolase
MSPIRDEFAKVPGTGSVVCDDDYTPDLCFLECFGSGVSKRAAVRFLRELGGYDRVVGFGDNLNDLPMFDECDECYAPENAKDELKAAAAAVIGSNREDGVARWLARRLNLRDEIH